MLYIVATPIGNLEDISFRAIRTLKESDYVLAEDTRRTKKLFSHYSLSNKLFSYNDFNKKTRTKKIIEDLKSGNIVSLVSDAGTPGISDPGFYLIRECIINKIKVSPVPGPSAAISALVGSGLPTDKFIFYGFLPRTEIKKRKIFEKLIGEKITAIFYESPHRINKTLKILSETIPDNEIVVARELTKKFEEFIRGTAKELYEISKSRKLKGEITLVIY